MDDAHTLTTNTSALQETKTSEDTVPLAVDLDGSLLKTDSLIESLLQLLKVNPLFFPVLFFWLFQGKAYLKQQVCRRVTLDVSSLPYNFNILSYLRDQKESNRKIILVTGSDQHIAQQIFNYLHFFDSVIASDGKTNMTGIQKKERLLAEFGPQGFDYLGNEKEDLHVWRIARQSLVVGSKSFTQQIGASLTNVERNFVIERAGIFEWAQALRLYQWLKNVLVFIPLLAAHRFLEVQLLFSVFVAFFSFGLCASSVYILNDLIDLTEDRRHPRKRFRPFASGTLPLANGIATCIVLLVLSVLVGLALPVQFYYILSIYYLTTLAYSLWLKKVVILDVIVLAGLFTIRMLAGSAAVNIWPSSWLLAHSMFLFISLALVKRYSELTTMRLEYGSSATARSYVVNDSTVLAIMGVASAFVSAFVLVLYIMSASAQLSYGRHNVIWLVCPLLLYWLCYIWLVAHRGKMHDDPMIFALRDRTSRIILLLMAIIMLFAT
ncbi:UbiA family prenyltransferase [Desulfosediminicola sp.]|uniref:UbiA family prenyltransferase n=1 Tax=Desulfosediminicola sp. TaxID=2886825 RepID=UPI003AF31122